MISLGKFNTSSKEIILEQRDNGCLECVSHAKDDCGYTRVRYKGKHNRLFRVVYEMQYGEIPKGMVIRHKCDNPSCCNIEHLELGTQKQNVQDMLERGRGTKGKPNTYSRGTLNKANKLSEEDVRGIYLSTLSGRKLAKIYGVSRVNISLIKNKKSWKWFTDKLDQCDY